MRLTWTTILKNKHILSLYVCLTLCLCSRKEDREKGGDTSAEFSDTIRIEFINSLDNTHLDNFSFGVCSGQDELPLGYIFQQNTYSTSLNGTLEVVRSHVANYDPEQDSLYGYFAKEGFLFKKFIVPRNVDELTIKIHPAPSTFTIRCVDSVTCISLDSVVFIFEFEENFTYENITPRANLPITEKFTFSSGDLKPNLDIMTHEILPNEKVKISITCYRGDRARKYVYKLKFQPWCKTIIGLI